MVSIAIDMGGTGCTAAIKSQDTISDLKVPEPGNIRNLGVEQFTERVSGIIAEFGINRLTEIETLVLGVAGYETPKDLVDIEEAITNISNSVKNLVVRNDSALALSAIPFSEEGTKVSVISGTGFNSAYEFNIPDSKVFSVGGSWYLGSDGDGAGFGIGRAGFMHALHEIQMRNGNPNAFTLDAFGYNILSPSILTQLVVEQFGSNNLQEAYSTIYSNSSDAEKVALLSAFAPVVANAAEQNDENAVRILQSAGTYCGDIVAQTLSLHGRKDAQIALTGGVINNNDIVRNAFLQKLKDAGIDSNTQGFSDTFVVLRAILEAA